MTCEKCVNAIKNCLSNDKDISKLDVSLDRGTVLVETKLPYTVIQEKIESLGKRAVLKGFGGGLIYRQKQNELCKNNKYHNY